VYAFNGDGPSNYSNVAEATTPKAIPNAPTNLAATPSKAGSTPYVDLKWQDNSNNEANFVVERCTGAGCSNFQPLVSVGANVTTYRDNRAAQRTTYVYRGKRHASATTVELTVPFLAFSSHKSTRTNGRFMADQIGPLGPRAALGK
jgi:hypothetical protein